LDAVIGIEAGVTRIAEVVIVGAGIAAVVVVESIVAVAVVESIVAVAVVVSIAAGVVVENIAAAVDIGAGIGAVAMAEGIGAAAGRIDWVVEKTSLGSKDPKPILVGLVKDWERTGERTKVHSRSVSGNQDYSSLEVAEMVHAVLHCWLLNMDLEVAGSRRRSPVHLTCGLSAMPKSVSLT